MDNCIFCKIVRGEAPSQRLYHDEWITAFRDIHPQAPTHILIISNKHIEGPLAVTADDAHLIGRIILAANRIAHQEGFAGGGFRIVANEGRDGGQLVDHLHFHLLAGRLLNWPPG